MEETQVQMSSDQNHVTRTGSCDHDQDQTRLDPTTPYDQGHTGLDQVTRTRRDQTR